MACEPSLYAQAPGDYILMGQARVQERLHMPAIKLTWELTPQMRNRRVLLAAMRWVLPLLLKDMKLAPTWMPTLAAVRLAPNSENC